MSKSQKQSKRQGNTLGKRSQASEYQLQSLDFSQTMFFVQTTQVAVGLFSLPRLVAEAADHSGWIAVLINGVLVQIALVIMVVLLRRFGNLSLYQIMRVVLGRWIGAAFGLIFALYCVSVAGMVSRAYIEEVQSWLFPTTSTWMFYVLLMIPALYCATGGARVLGRFAVLTFFATIWMILLLITPISLIQTDYYFPLWDATMPQMAKATWNVFTSTIGFELLMVIYPFIQKKNKTMLAASIGVWQTTAIYLFIVLVAIGFYGEELIKTTLMPTLDMFQVVEIPLLQRIEHIVISTWSFLVLSTVAAYLWAAGRFLYEISKWKEQRCILMFFPLLYVLAILPRDVYFLAQFENLMGSVGAMMIFGMPILLLLVAIIRKKRGKDTKQVPAQEGAA